MTANGVRCLALGLALRGVQKNQTFTAIFTKDHAVGAAVPPTIWPTPILNEEEDVASGILGVVSPNVGRDLTVALRT